MFLKKKFLRFQEGTSTSKFRLDWMSDKRMRFNAITRAEPSQANQSKGRTAQNGRSRQVSLAGLTRVCGRHNVLRLAGVGRTLLLKHQWDTVTRIANVHLLVSSLQWVACWDSTPVDPSNQFTWLAVIVLCFSLQPVTGESRKVELIF